MGTPVMDVEFPDNPARKSLLLDKHADYIEAFEKDKDDFEYCSTEFLRVSGVYWGLTAMDLMGQLHRMNKTEVLEFVKSCQHASGGFSPILHHDPHLLYTLSAVQVLTLYDSTDIINVEGVVKFVASLQQPDGSFIGDKWGEVDTRFSFCSLACLALLGRLDAVDVGKAVQFVLSCMNFDGGFGRVPGSESHAGQVYCCVGALAVAGALYHVDADRLGWWLCERQLPSGGLNGRPQKLPDVCYSWWVLASLKMVGRLHWIDKEKLTGFILACQDEETGGFSDRPGDWAFPTRASEVPRSLARAGKAWQRRYYSGAELGVDPFHTLFGLAGLSLLGSKQVKPVNPVFCMPEDVLDRIGLKPKLLT